jgi:hypothetical protein
MKQQFKSIIAAAALGLWAYAAEAHHIAGNVICTDTTPATFLDGVSVRVQGASGSTFTGVTFGGGYYVIDLPTATEAYTVTITPPAGMTLVTPASGSYVLTVYANGVGGPDSYDGVNFYLTGCTTPPVLGRIGDTVFCDTNSNGTQDPGEAGIPGVKIDLVVKNTSGATIHTATTTTDANGRYVFTNVPAGAAEVTVDRSTVPAPCNGTVCAEVVRENMSPGEIFNGADFCFTPPPLLGRIGDTVYCDANTNSVQDAGEAGIPGVKVNLVVRNAGGAVIATATATTDANGKYLFVDVPAGTATVTVDVSSVTGDCDIAVCDTTVVIVLGLGEINLNADFCFTDEQEGPGTGTPGYWKNHPAAWPVDSITIGGTTYTKAQAIAWLNTAEKGDKTVTVFRALVSAKLNVLLGNASACITEAIAAADAWLAAHPVGSKVSGDSAAWAEISANATRLDDYNNGLLCAPHRE